MPGLCWGWRSIALTLALQDFACLNSAPQNIGYQAPVSFNTLMHTARQGLKVGIARGLVALVEQQLDGVGASVVAEGTGQCNGEGAHSVSAGGV